jgi:hypothetical protein
MAFGNTAYWWLLRQEIKAGRRNRPLETGVFVFEPIPWKNGYHNLNYSDPNFQMTGRYSDPRIPTSFGKWVYTCIALF